jgi:hypothetical protein
MGYDTCYSLSVLEPADIDVSEILSRIKRDEKTDDYWFGGLDYAIDVHGDCLDSARWYEHEEDMIELSQRNPDVVFCLWGRGEDNDDIWYKYFKNGLIQRCHANITFDDYDEKMLE